MTVALFKKILRYATIILTTLLLFMIGLSVLVAESSKKPPEVRNRIMADLKNQAAIQASLPKPWPPQMNKPYPNFGLVDQEGKAIKLSDFRGKVILIENVDMGNKVSQALSGGIVDLPEAPQPIQKIVGEYSEGKVSLPNPEIILIKILYYNEKGERPTQADAARWAAHFKLSRTDNVIVAVPDQDMRAYYTSLIIPGYQLVDRAFNLRVDSAGENPKHSLEMTLIPLLAKLL